MSFKERFAKYGEEFNRKAIFDVILSCKICIAAVYVIYAGVFWFSALPNAYDFAVVPKIILTLLGAALATLMTMPLYFTGVVFLGLFFRVCEDGRCCLCRQVKKLVGIGR